MRQKSGGSLGNHSADILGFASGVAGLGRRRGGRFSRVHRDFVPSPNV
jgi:hypothetical protein